MCGQLARRDEAGDRLDPPLGRSRERWLHATLYLLASLTLYQAGRDIEATWTATRALEVKHETGDATVTLTCDRDVGGTVHT